MEALEAIVLVMAIGCMFLYILEQNVKAWREIGSWFEKKPKVSNY